MNNKKTTNSEKCYYGIHIPEAVEIIERERTYMALPENVPVYSCKFIGFDKDNRVVEYTEMFARCDMFELNLDSR